MHQLIATKLLNHNLYLFRMSLFSNIQYHLKLGKIVYFRILKKKIVTELQLPLSV